MTVISTTSRFSRVHPSCLVGLTRRYRVMTLPSNPPQPLNFSTHEDPVRLCCDVISDGSGILAADSVFNHNPVRLSHVRLGLLSCRPQGTR